MIRTIIVDDELLAGVGVQSLIHGKKDIAVAGVFQSAEEALAYLRENIVDIVITDIEMGDVSGLELIRVIREDHLADGVIILSCHDDFSYAQEAISQGTDCYLLKHSITEQLLIGEIEKVYQKRQGLRGRSRDRSAAKPPSKPKHAVYTIGVLRFSGGENNHADVSERMEKTMLVHLLEGIVARYEMGTLYAPYNREIFIIFQQEQEQTPLERKNTLQSNLAVIIRSLRQYTNSRACFGVSTTFADFKQIYEKYDEALAAAELAFYYQEQTAFFYQRQNGGLAPVVFSIDRFQQPEGLEVFRTELSEYLHRAGFHQLAVRDLRAQLLQAVGQAVYQVLHGHHFSQELVKDWSFGAAWASAITYAENAEELERNLAEVFGRFRRECLVELEKDGLAQALEYIRQNLDGKLSLPELAAVSYMSVPTFSKKFKERTGLTLVQYLNEQRIERAKVLLKDPRYSLEQIAAATGFSNANYLIRVFKKVTGQTVSEYRG